MKSDFQTKPKQKGSKSDKQRPLLPEPDPPEPGMPRSRHRSFMHFWAMVKKDYIIYKRNIKRQVTEILVPMFLIFILVMIHWNVPRDYRDPPEKIDNAAMVFGPLANSQRMGLANNSREMMVDSMLMQVADYKDFYEYQNITDPAQVMSTSVFVTWRGDNCKETSLNKARERWAIIGDVENSQIIKELKQDVEDFLYFKEHSKKHVKELNEKMAKLMPDMSHFTVSDSKIASPVYRPKPLEFRTEEEFSQYLNHPDYELVDERPGICFGIQISDNVGTPDEEENGPDIQVRVHMESKPGRTPTDDKKPHEKSFSQRCLFSSSIDPKDDFAAAPDVDCIPLLIQQGFSYIHNWVANAAMRVMTRNHQSEIVLSMVPFKVDRIEINEFEHAMTGIFSYIQIMIYLLPIYGFILRLQEEKIVGLKQHLTILGLSQRAQLLALFLSYAAQITLVCCGILFTMWAGDLFPKSLSQSPGLFFLYFWIQGIAGFGFVIMIVALLPENMYPKLAAQWGTLIYFGSTFADFTIQKQQIPELYKVIMSVIFPTLATARSSRNLVLFEYKIGGPGLTWESIFTQYDQYRMISYYAIMAFSFFFHLSIGLLFERYGSLPKIIERAFDFILRRSDIVEASGLKALKQTSKGVSSDNFERDERDCSRNDVLEVRDLVKIFKSHSKSKTDDEDTKNSKTNQGFFCAVDHINMKLYKNEIFSFLGHNGAGKTTTISMLTGMLEASQGKVECFGRTVFDMGSRSDNSQGIQDFRQILGVCPQHDILFDLMTVEEHLDIFCDFKGVKQGKQDKIEKILRDVGLQEHRKQRAGDLSGGNKRKLSVALALVTDSKIVFLDEPTSGMDLTARRRLWNMLKEYRKDRIIILTTHNMDEADLLGDRVGMMKNGRLVCLGTSRFLKDKFKQRYQLKILLKSTALGDKQTKKKICEYMKKEISHDVTLFEHTDKELNFNIPLDHRDKLAQFFSSFDLPATLARFKIESYVIKMTSLEDVFLDIGEGIEESEPKTEDDILDDDTPVLQEPDLDAAAHHLEDINDQIDTYRKERPYLDTVLRQTGMLIVRQLQAYMRNLPSFAFDVSLPSILVGLGLLFSMFQFAIISKEVNLEVATFRLPQRVMVNTATHFSEPIDDDDFDEDAGEKEPTLFTIDPMTIAESMPGFDQGEIQLEYYDHMKDLAELEKLDQAYRVSLAEQNVTLAEQYDELLSFNKSAGNKLFRQRLFDTRFWDANMTYPDFEVKNQGNDTAFSYRYGSMFVYEANNMTKKFKVQAHVNLTNCYSQMHYPHFIYQGVLRAATGKKNLNFNLTTVPFPDNPRTKEWEHEANGVFLCFVAGIGLAMIPASIISRVVGERESEVKHIQIVSGVKLEAYWLSFLLFDLIKAYISSFIIVGILLLLGVEGGMAISHVVLFFPLAIIPFTYTMSFAYEREITAQSFTIYLNFIFSGVFGMIVFVLRMIKQTAMWGDRFVWLCRVLSPLFNVCDAFLYTSTKTIFQERREEIIKEIKMGPKPWNLPGPLDIDNDFSFQNLGGNISALLFQTAFWWLIFIWLESRKSREFSLFASPLPPKKTDQELQMDEDVKREEVRVGKNPDQMVQVHKFRKAYQIPFSNPVMAVERASFGVNKGECFALLGVNGAGKSTTFKSLTNVVQPTDGKVNIMGKSISEDFNEVRHRIGYCPQMHTLFNHVTVLEHLKFFAELKGIPDMIQPRLINQVIKKFGIQRHINKEAQQLSGGTKRKLQVAIALLGNPCVVLLDEPSAGMDPAARKFMWKVVKGITDHDQKTCVVLTTHQMEEAEELSTKMGIMVQGGQFTCFGSCQHIKDKFGGGYEVEVKFKDSQDVEGYAAKLKMAITSKKTLQEYTDASIACKLLPSGKKQMFLSYIKRNVCFQEGLSADKIENLLMEFPKFSGFLNSFLSFQKLAKHVLQKSKFPRLDIIETYGFAFVKFRVPKGNNSLGYLIGIIEEFMQERSKEAQQIEEYIAQETSLEVIFQYFASPNRSEQNKLREQQENAYIHRVQKSDCNIQ